jgi:lipoic acid synthetase
MCQCFAKKTATFMIMGDVCTRNCTFCAITKGKPSPLDNGEPERIATAVKRLGLEYVVITSVTRDDLDDGGASHFARTIETVRLVCPGTKVEVLIPDFQGLDAAIETVINAKPSVINHNIETVPRLYSQVRPLAGYRRSLDLLSSIKKIDPGMVTKSGLMLGLGEKREEVIEVMKELRKAGCNLITLGQYLAPSSQHHPVINYVTPKEFSGYIQPALEMGFSGIASAPLVRSSYKAAELYQQGRPCA